MSRPSWALALASLTFIPFARDSFELPHALVLVGGALVATQWSLSREFKGSLLILFGAALLTTLTSTSIALSFPGLLVLTAVLVFGAVSATVDWRPLLFASVPVGAWAVVQGLGFDVFEWQDVARWCGGVRPFSTLGHPTQLGVFMAAVATLALDAGVRRSRWYWLVAVTASVVCVATLSRAGWVTLIIGISLYALLRLRQFGAWYLAALLMGTAGAVVLGAKLVGFAQVVERVTNALVAPTRVAMVKTALAGFAEHPWLGWGFDSFVLVDQQLRMPEVWKFEWGTTAFHAHSFPAQVLATQGLVGALAALAVVGLTLRGWWRQRALRQFSAEVSVVVAFSIASLFTFHGVLTAALWVAALAKSLREAEPSRPPCWARLGLVFPLAVISLSLVSSVFSVRGANGLERASSLEPWNPTWPALLGHEYEHTGRLDLAKASYEDSAKRVPELAVSHSNLGRVASRQADVATTLREFEIARRLAPLDAHIARESAEASLRLGQLELAAGTLENTLGVYPSDALAWFTLGRVRVLQNRPREARAMLEASLESDWRDWPEGLGVARRLLTIVLLEAGEPARAYAISRGAISAPLPADACGAPAKLR